ncbi:hypothetical protein M8C21_031758, partial [Ambrosia artemisiifolia]
AYKAAKKKTEVQYRQFLAPIVHASSQTLLSSSLAMKRHLRESCGYIDNNLEMMRASMVCGNRDEKCWLDVKASAYSMKSDVQKQIIFDIKSKHEGDEDLNDIHKQKKSKYSMNRSAIALILGALQESRSARQKHRIFNDDIYHNFA